MTIAYKCRDIYLREWCVYIKWAQAPETERNVLRLYGGIISILLEGKAILGPQLLQLRDDAVKDARNTYSNQKMKEGDADSFVLV